MAANIGASVWAVRKWRQRDSIPSEWWVTIESAARHRGLDLTVSALANISARKLRDPPHDADRVAPAGPDGGPSTSGPALSGEAAE